MCPCVLFACLLPRFEVTAFTRPRLPYTPVFSGEHVPETIEYGISSIVFRAKRPFHPKRLYDLLYNSATMQDVVRSKGYCWLACPHGYTRNVKWGHAGVVFQFEAGARWWGSRDEATWPVGLKDMIGDKWDDVHGDRHQEVVLIGVTMDADVVTDALQKCLLTDAEFAEPVAAWDAFENPFGDFLDVPDEEDDSDDSDDSDYDTDDAEADEEDDDNDDEEEEEEEEDGDEEGKEDGHADSKDAEVDDGGDAAAVADAPAADHVHGPGCSHLPAQPTGVRIIRNAPKSAAAKSVPRVGVAGAGARAGASAGAGSAAADSDAAAAAAPAPAPDATAASTAPDASS